MTTRFTRQAPEVRKANKGFLNVLIRSPETSLVDQSLERLDTLDGAFADIADIIDMPELYTRPDRLLGEVAEERGGYVINWAPGYLAHHRPRVRKIRGRVTIQILTTRPFHPVFTPEARRRWTRLVWAWIRQAEASGEF